MSGLDGWHEAHAVRVRTGEIYVSQCWTQKIASMSRRGRFITLPWGRDWLLPTKRLFRNRQIQFRHAGTEIQIEFFMALADLIKRDVLTHSLMPKWLRETTGGPPGASVMHPGRLPHQELDQK